MLEENATSPKGEQEDLTLRSSEKSAGTIEGKKEIYPDAGKPTENNLSVPEFSRRIKGILNATKGGGRKIISRGGKMEPRLTFPREGNKTLNLNSLVEGETRGSSGRTIRKKGRHCRSDSQVNNKGCFTGKGQSAKRTFSRKGHGEKKGPLNGIKKRGKKLTKV